MAIKRLSCVPQTVSELLFYYDIVRYYNADTCTLLDSFNEFCLLLNAVYTPASHLINCKEWRYKFRALHYGVLILQSWLSLLVPDILQNC
jgi:hypothetical protein